ncbi:zinc finger, CCHC-type containing protein [Tanacetum coccineum]
MTTSVGNNSVFRSFFEKQKLTGPNFIDWYRQLRLVLSTEDKEYYLEHPIPVAPVAPPGQQIPPEDLAAHAAWVKGQKEVAIQMAPLPLYGKQWQVEDNKLADVAAVSAGNNQEVGSMITEAMSKVQRKGVVTLEETKSADNYLQVPQTLKMQNLLGEARGNGNLVMFI